MNDNNVSCSKCMKIYAKCGQTPNGIRVRSLKESDVNLIDTCDDCRDEARSCRICQLNFPSEYFDRKTCLRWGGIGLDLCRCGLVESPNYEIFQRNELERYQFFKNHISDS